VFSRVQSVGGRDRLWDWVVGTDNNRQRLIYAILWAWFCSVVDRWRVEDRCWVIDRRHELTQLHRQQWLLWTVNTNSSASVTESSGRLVTNNAAPGRRGHTATGTTPSSTVDDKELIGASHNSIAVVESTRNEGRDQRCHGALIDMASV